MNPIIAAILKLGSFLMEVFVEDRKEREKSIKQFLDQVEKYDKRAVDNVTHKKNYDDLKKRMKDYLDE